jgi:hypothetical protein
LEVNKYKDFIDKLLDRKEFLLNRKKIIDAELKDIDKKVKRYKDRLKHREVEETIILANKHNISITDIKNVIKSGDTDKLKELLNEKED